MKKFALCVALAVMATGAMAKEWKTVRIGVDASYPPFESKAPSGEVVGFDADLTRALCAQDEREVRLGRIRIWTASFPR